MIRFVFFIVIVILVVILLFLNENKKKEETTNESKKESDTNELSEVYSVERFNNWFNDKDNGSYAGPGIFLRLDKLSDVMFEEYFTSVGIEDAIGRMSQEGYEKFRAFEQEVRKDWVKKRNEKNE